MEAGQSVSWGMAFLAGVASFLSPCVLPLIPSYLAFITGLSLSELTDQKKSAKVKRTTVISTVAFILGFSAVFIGLGAGATKIGLLLIQHKVIISRVAGVIVVIFGLYIMGVLKIRFLSKHKQLEVKHRPAGYIGSFLIGIAFSIGWTPCVGPILAGILLYASQSGSISKGIYLLCFYSLGMAIPFFVTSIAVDTFFGYFTKIKKHMRKINIAAGILLILVGVMIFMDWLSWINEYLAPDFDDEEVMRRTTPRGVGRTASISHELFQAEQAEAAMQNWARPALPAG